MSASTRRWSVWFNRLIPIVAFVVFGFAVAFIARVFSQYTWSEIIGTIGAIPRDDLYLAMALTALSYFVLCTYDLMAMRHIRGGLPTRQVFFAAFSAFAISNSIGLSSLAGSSVRLRLYTGYGLKPSQILRLILFVTSTFWLGFFAIAGITLHASTLPLPEAYALAPEFTKTLGSIFLGLAISYAVACGIRREPIVLKGQELTLPTPLLATVQTLTAAFDWALAAAVLYLLLPHDQVGFFSFLSIFVSAQVIALVANVPGGVGVLEALVIYFMSTNNRATPAVLGGLLAYRLIYYIAPLVVATVLVAYHEISRRREPETIG